MAMETTSTGELPALLTVKAVARLLACCPRHVSRLSEAGLMPQPVRLGALVRWQRDVVMTWINQGCPSCR